MSAESFKEKRNAYMRAWNAKNRERVRENARDANLSPEALALRKASRARAMRRYREVHAERFKEYARERNRTYETTVKGRAHKLLNAAKGRNKKGEFSLTLEHVINGIEAGSCPKTGVPFDMSPSSEGGKPRYRPWAPSLDRLDSSKPYANGNVQVVCYAYNVAKHQGSDGDFVALCRMVVKMVDNQ